MRNRGGNCEANVRTNGAMDAKRGTLTNKGFEEAALTGSAGLQALNTPKAPRFDCSSVASLSQNSDCHLMKAGPGQCTVPNETATSVASGAKGYSNKGCLSNEAGHIAGALALYCSACGKDVTVLLQQSALEQKGSVGHMALKK